MAASGTRAQKPVGSAAWISTEKENMVQLVEQEMEEAEYPVRHEMDWLNEHMAEIFSKNQFNMTDVFKTPGKLRGKTPRTARKRVMDESRVPLSEIFSAARNHDAEVRPSPSPMVSRALAKAASSSATPSPSKKEAQATTTQPPYPDLTKNLNSFPKYNTDSGYHGMPDDDEVVPAQTPQHESQTSTQPLEDESTPIAPHVSRSSPDRRTTQDSFHSAHEDIRQRGDTVEPMNLDSVPNQPSSLSPQKSEQNKPVHTVTPEPKQRTEPEPKVQQQKAPEPVKAQQVEEPGSEEVLEPMSESEDGMDSEPEQVLNKIPSPIKTPAVSSKEENNDKEADIMNDDMELDVDDIGSPSDGSTPERPFIRKSSLSFASLPAREPLTTKKSIGATRMSRTSHIDVAKLGNNANNNRSSYFGKHTGGPRTTQLLSSDNDPAAGTDRMEADGNLDAAQQDTEADRASKIHNKSSTQLLHEKISMLGKLQPSRPTKSIPAVQAQGPSASQVSYPELPAPKAESKLESTADNPRETLAPETKDIYQAPKHLGLSKSQTTDVMEKLYDRAAATPVEKEYSTQEQPPVAKLTRNSSTVRTRSSTPVPTSPQRLGHQKSVSVTNLASEQSTTPNGSPRRHDGPLSASKTRLQSIMKSAKGLFTSAASVSAAAKLEARPSTPTKIQPSTRALSHDETEQQEEPRPAPVPSRSPKPEGRRTRSSTEREERRRQQELEERQREQDLRERYREQERQKAEQAKALQQKEKEKQAVEVVERPAPVPALATMASPKKPTQLRKPSSKELEPTTHDTTARSIAPPVMSQQPPKQNDRRPMKPSRETLQKPKPQPVSIRVGSALSRMPLPSAPIPPSVQEVNAPAPTPASVSKPPTLKKKASNASLHTAAASSTSSFKTSVSSQTQRKAQLAIERKREQQEREARRKEEQKRELERRRAVQQQEESRRQELRSRAEAERVEKERERLAAEDPKKAAKMQAIEKRRLENARRTERQGSQQPTLELGSILQQERTGPQTSQRSDLAAARPASRLGSIQPFGRSINTPAPNPAKPPKRALDEEASHRPVPTRASTAYQSNDSKRRKTEDEQPQVPPVRPTMAPPIRQSAIRKESVKPLGYNHGHPQPSLSHQSGSSIFKTGSLASNSQPQRPAHPMDMAKYTSGKIPFADPPTNPAGPPAHHASSAASASKSVAKPSPKYPNGENIHLPEIPTDSEDEESDTEILPVPKWAQPKELDAILRRQEGMEVDSIFGPIAPFSLEETFKADKKLKKFRERTSSANWSGPDGLTQEEIRRDNADRQRLRMNGAWTFDM
ncbi:hypothetical protein ASPZODRAFT_129445 [Penicilliopsis zonata CBS 506.65]|uniref:Inner centromere protein ARK-binding domain-containing protein n=1 Tax=Penicilliopsis zonata CBS 506.65 TaxID=1073090 RepID=A0A1L9SPG5_9EURO|nr:hypothetical protein ASPZODRAFT_129445 [Penicilliopsis zonata CBS 506.65]OJJ49068.1 hypothetical protein ASPZODRAFT_129445 [Penicilliopsis zonata CBS 506.65]